MLSIRLSRGGAKNRPYYRIVVAEKANARDGRFLEVIGASNPMAAGKEPSLKFKADRYEYWCGQGAQPSLCVKRLYRQHKRAGKSAPSAAAAAA